MGRPPILFGFSDAPMMAMELGASAAESRSFMSMEARRALVKEGINPFAAFLPVEAGDKGVTFGVQLLPVAAAPGGVDEQLDALLSLARAVGQPGGPGQRGGDSVAGLRDSVDEAESMQTLHGAGIAVE
jgi:hypothetical protein